MPISSNSPKSKLAIIILFMAMILFLFVSTTNNLRMAIVSKHWPSTTGLIVSSNLVESTNTKNQSIKYNPEIKYSYSVGSNNYSSKRYMMYISGKSSRTWAENIINQYPVNSEVIVYYNPGRPKIAVLKPGPTGGIFIWVITSFIFLSVLSVVLVKHIKNMRTGAPNVTTINTGDLQGREA